MLVNVRAVVRCFIMFELSKCYFFVDIVFTEHLVFGSFVDNEPIWRLCATSTGERVRLSSLSSRVGRRGEHFSGATSRPPPPPPPARWAPTSIFKDSQVCGGFARLEKLTLQFPPRHMLDMEEKLEETGF